MTPRQIPPHVQALLEPPSIWPVVFSAVTAVSTFFALLGLALAGVGMVEW